MKKKSRIILSVLSAMMLAALTACGGAQPAQTSSGFVPGSSAEVSIDANAKTKTVFLEDTQYSGTVTNEEEAEKALYALVERLGGDETTEFVYHDQVTNADDTVFYSFEQAFGGIEVYGSSIKLIADKDGKVLAVSSTIITDLQETPSTAWKITLEEAEQIVQEEIAETGEKVISGATEQTILKMQDGYARYVWVVYSDNKDPESEKAYLAHYVNGAGEYLYELPVSAPGNEDALNGSVSVFAFEGYEEGTWTGIVRDCDGPEREISVPLMIDQETGKQILGDLERRILCADYYDYYYEDTLTPITSDDGTWVNNELITYEMLIRVWDFYDQLGWHGPDGEGTPMLILMGLCDENKMPIDNAYYAGKQNGFQVFKINDDFGDGTCSDIMGHEFTHCVTSTSLISELYFNDFGAINESMSDIMGNLIEMEFGDSPDGAWILSERHTNGAIRSMKNPHDFSQPEYTWDVYYYPNSDTPDSETNDLGGVHRNDSILNQISYKLGQAGMQPEEQIYFWLNVDMALTSTTDYPLLSEILPFILNMTGYSQYMDALNQAIADTRMADKEIPQEIPSDQAFVTIELPVHPEEIGYNVTCNFTNYETEAIHEAWIVSGTKTIAVTIPAGRYLVTASFVNKENPEDVLLFAATKDGWRLSDGTVEDLLGADADGRDILTLQFEGGEQAALETASMAERLAQLNIIK